jgi:hypoxia up-regulated 1
LKSLHPDAVQASKDKLAYLQLLDDERKYKLETKNALESYLYAVKNRMEDEAEVMDAISTEEQREALNENVRSNIDWLDDDGFDAKSEEYISRKVDVSELAEPIFFRAEESTARPEAVHLIY